MRKLLPILVTLAVLLGSVSASASDHCDSSNPRYIYRENPDISIRTLAKELGIPFNVVWECLGFKDWFDFEDMPSTLDLQTLVSEP